MPPSLGAEYERGRGSVKKLELVRPEKAGGCSLNTCSKYFVVFHSIKQLTSTNTYYYSTVFLASTQQSVLTLCSFTFDQLHQNVSRIFLKCEIPLPSLHL